MAKKDEHINLAVGDKAATIKDAVIAPDGTVRAAYPAIPAPPITDEIQRRQLAQHLHTLYYMQANIAGDIGARHMKSTDLVGIATFLSTFYDACRREYEDKIDYKVKGSAGHGHSLTSVDITSLARAIIMVFGPEFMTVPEQKKLFLEVLTSEAQDVVDTLLSAAS